MHNLIIILFNNLIKIQLEILYTLATVGQTTNECTISGYLFRYIFVFCENGSMNTVCYQQTKCIKKLRKKIPMFSSSI